MQDKQTALSQACKTGRHKIVEKLLRRPDLKVNICDKVSKVLLDFKKIPEHHP